MKKNYFKVLIAVAVATVSFNQQTYAQAVEEENIVIEAYYGFPNLYTSVFKAAYANSGGELDLNAGGIGPFGVRFEYLVTDKVGLGLDFGLTGSSISFNELGTVYNPTTGNYDNILYNYDFSTRKIGALFCFNYHFLDNDEFDLYSTVGVGYSKRNFDFTSTDPSYEPMSVSSVIPVGFKAGLGMRYFFTDNIGANLNLGFGIGGLLNAGLSVKL
jgi:opacity protein-like surface antigen